MELFELVADPVPDSGIPDDGELEAELPERSLFPIISVEESRLGEDMGDDALSTVTVTKAVLLT